MNFLEHLRNKRKPILGAIAGALTYLATKVGLDLDPEIAALISGLIFTAVVERVRPIFGEHTVTPKPLTEPAPKRRGAHLER